MVQGKRNCRITLRGRSYATLVVSSFPPHPFPYYPYGLQCLHRV